MFNRSPPDICVLQLVYQISVDLFAEVCNGATSPVENDWLIIVWDLSLGLGVDSDELEIIPNGIVEFVEVPLLVSAYGYEMGHLVENFQFFHRDGVNFVQQVYAGNVSSIPIEGID